MLNQENLVSRTQMSEWVNGTCQTALYQGKLWQVVNSKIDFAKDANSKWVSLGGGVLRERLFFDSNAPFIQSLKKQILQSCRGKPIKQCLFIINKAVNSLNGETIITPEKEVKRTEEVGKFLANQKSRHIDDSLDLSIETFVEKKLLICRHKSLLAASLLSHLVKQHILPEGKVRQYRSTLKQGNEEKGVHTWAVYRDGTNGYLWICDPHWSIVVNAYHAGQAVFNEYGDVTIREMIKRLEAQDALKPRAEVMQRQFFPAFQKKHLTTMVGRWKIMIPLKQKTLGFYGNDEFPAFKPLTEDGEINKTKNSPAKKPLILRPPFWRP